MLEMSGVGLRRGGVTLLDGLSLRFPDPGLYLLQGACGSGKSLLGRIASGRLRPDAGSVLLDGTPLYSPHDPATVIRSIFRPPPATGPLFHAALGQAMSEGENLYEYLDVELWRAGSPITTLQPFWEILERAIPVARRRTLGSLSLSELALAQLALGVAMPARVVVLDGQLACLDKGCFPVAQKLLGLITAQDRFVILTAPPEVGEIGRATHIALAGGLPVTVVESIDEAESAT